MSVGGVDSHQGPCGQLVGGGHLCVSALSALSCFPRTLCVPGVDRKLPGLCTPPPSSTSCTCMVTCTANQKPPKTPAHAVISCWVKPDWLFGVTCCCWGTPGANGTAGRADAACGLVGMGTRGRPVGGGLPLCAWYMAGAPCWYGTDDCPPAGGEDWSRPTSISSTDFYTQVT